jgi:serine/threonine protein kinase
MKLLNNKLKIHTLIGKGGTSKCYLTENEESHDFVVVKKFKKQHSQDKQRQFMKNILNEFSIASTLDHPNIIHTFDILFENDNIYEVFELCPNGDLFSFIQKNKNIPTETINSIFFQLLNGVQYLHSLGICHRDLKPENCMFDKENHLKIIDFGCAKVVKLPFHTITQLCSEKCGTTPYMAPEEFTLEQYNGMSVDIWSCAIIYIVMLYHTFPWYIARKDDPQFSVYLKQQTIFGKKKKSHFLMQMLDIDHTKRIKIKPLITLL